MVASNSDIVERVLHFFLVEDLKVIVSVGFIGLVFIFLWSNISYYRRWVYKGQKIRVDRIRDRLKRVIYYGVVQRRLIQANYLGVMHALVFIGLGGLTISTILRSTDFYFFQGSQILQSQIYLFYKFGSNISGIIALIGLSMALLRRLGRATKGLPNTPIDNLLLLDLIIIVVTGFLMDGIATLNYRLDWIGGWDPVGTRVLSFFTGYSPSILESIYRTLWGIHLSLSFISMAFIAHTKLSHMWVGGIINTFFSRLDPPNTLKPIHDLYEIIEGDGTIGVQRASETTWKQRMDFDSCVECARCHNACPAQVSGKPLSPMRVEMNMRGLMRGEGWEKPIWPNHVEINSIWSCVACGACVSVCPLLIDPVDTIMDLRRGLYFEEENVFREIKEISFNIMSDGNPYGFSSVEKREWTKKLVEDGLCDYAHADSEYDYLYWIGCVINHDPKLRLSTESLLKILKKLGKRVAILEEEQCCGDPSRRIGDELMFVEMAKTNHEELLRFKFGKMLTSCPHCFNSFRYGYSQNDLALDVEHYTTVIDELLRETELDLIIDGTQTVTYHDPCFLGRWNKVYDAPRRIIENIEGVTLTEMSRYREESFCCGGGGGHMFFEVEEGERISKLRMAESHETGAEILLVACPYCSTMLGTEASEKTRVMDIAELLEAAINTSSTIRLE
jgi:Fe-S oxidoreductase/nitrate reductase gamma subunit